MGGGVGGYKAGAFGAVVGQVVHTIRQFGVLAGAEAENAFFYQVAADHIAEAGRAAKKQEPGPAAFAEIDGYKYEQKKVEGEPEAGFADKGEDGVEEAVGPVYVNKVEYFTIQWFNVLEPGERGL